MIAEACVTQSKLNRSPSYVAKAPADPQRHSAAPLITCGRAPRCAGRDPRYVPGHRPEGEGEASQWWRVTAFSEGVQTELMRLADGDAVSVQGSFKAELYQPDGGEPKVSLSIIAECMAGRERHAPRDADLAGGGIDAPTNAPHNNKRRSALVGCADAKTGNRRVKKDGALAGRRRFQSPQKAVCQ